MKKTYISFLLFSLFCLLSSSVIAQTQVSDSASFATAFNAMKTTGGGSIELTASVTFRIAKNTTYALESDASNAIQIDTKAFSIIASGDGTSADSCFLKIGNNVNITGSNIVLTNLNRGHIRVVGGSVNCVTTTNGAAAILATNGWVFIHGGTVSVNATGLTAGNSATAVQVNQYMSTVVLGGTISATGDYTRAIFETEIGNGIVKPFSGATISATGKNAYGILVLGAGATTPRIIGNNLTITTSSSDASDIGISSGGSSTVIIIPANTTNLNITSASPYKVENATAALLDLRGATLTANPVSGTLVNPANVTFTASGNSSLTSATKIYYNYSALAPTTSSTTINSGGTINVSAATNTITAIIGYPYSPYNTTTYTFNYIVQNPVGPTPVTSFTGLKNAYLASTTATDTVRLKLMNNITDSIAYSIIPDATHPIVIDANGFQLNVGIGTSTHTLTLGGSLRVFSSIAPTNGLFRLYGATTLNFTGGTYTLYTSKPIVDLETGSSISDTQTTINMTNSIFNVWGTTSASSIIKTVTSNGYQINATNCTFNLNAKAIAFNLIGMKLINLKNCNMNIGSDATSQAFYQAPTNAATGYGSFLTIDGLALNMTSGTVFTWGGSKNIATVIKDLTLTGAATIAKPSGGTGTSRLYYDFRAFNLTATPGAGNYATTQSVALASPVNGSGITNPVDALGATIVYTTDGSEPTALSTAYASPITVSTTTTIKTATLKDGYIGKSASFLYSLATTLINNTDDNNVSVFPTIVSDVLHISKLADFVQLYDITGKVVLSKASVDQINLTSIQSGIYFVKICLSDATSKTMRIIKK